MVAVRKITVSILGAQYNLVSDEQEQDILEAARLTESTLGELRTSSRHAELSEQSLSTLALLIVSLQAVRRGKESVMVQQKVHSLLCLIDSAVGVSQV